MNKNLIPKFECPQCQANCSVDMGDHYIHLECWNCKLSFFLDRSHGWDWTVTAIGSREILAKEKMVSDFENPFSYSLVKELNKDQSLYKIENLPGVEYVISSIYRPKADEPVWAQGRFEVAVFKANEDGDIVDFNELWMKRYEDCTELR